MTATELFDAVTRENFIRATTREPRVILADLRARLAAAPELDWDAFEALGEDGDTDWDSDGDTSYDAYLLAHLPITENPV